MHHVSKGYVQKAHLFVNTCSGHTKYHQQTDYLGFYASTYLLAVKAVVRKHFLRPSLIALAPRGVRKSIAGRQSTEKTLRAEKHTHR